MNCRYCGAQNDGDAIFCGQCGLQLIDDETVVRSPYDTVNTSASNSLNKWRMMMINKFGRIPNLYDMHLETLSEIEGELRLNPHDADAHFESGKILIALERYEEALSAFDEALRLDQTKDVQTLSYRGEALYELGKYEEALSILDEALRLEPHDADAHFYRAQTLYKLERYEEALSAIDETLRLQPNGEHIVLVVQGEILKALGQDE